MPREAKGEPQSRREWRDERANDVADDERRRGTHARDAVRFHGALNDGQHGEVVRIRRREEIERHAEDTDDDVEVRADCLREDVDECERDFLEHAGFVEDAEEHGGGENDPGHGERIRGVATEGIALFGDTLEIDDERDGRADEERRGWAA